MLCIVFKCYLRISDVHLNWNGAIGAYENLHVVYQLKKIKHYVAYGKKQ